MRKSNIYCNVGNSENHKLDISFLVNGSNYQIRNF